MTARDPFDAIPGLEHPGVQLIASIFMDAVGMLTYLFPLVGEFGDLLWAPLQALFIVGMVGGEGRGGLALAGLGFAEEILPFTDFVPSCTIAWIWKFARR